MKPPLFGLGKIDRNRDYQLHKLQSCSPYHTLHAASASMSVRQVLALLLVSLLASVVTAQYAHESIVNLGNDFTEKVSDGRVHFIKFYAPWCGHCKRLAPTWKQLADHYNSSDSVSVAHVDCTQSKDVCSKAEVRGYPSLKVYYNGEDYQTYRGSRDLESLKQFLDKTAKELLTETVE